MRNDAARAARRLPSERHWPVAPGRASRRAGMGPTGGGSPFAPPRADPENSGVADASRSVPSITAASTWSNETRRWERRLQSGPVGGRGDRAGRRGRLGTGVGRAARATRAGLRRARRWPSGRSARSRWRPRPPSPNSISSWPPGEWPPPGRVSISVAGSRRPGWPGRRGSGATGSWPHCGRSGPTAPGVSGTERRWPSPSSGPGRPSGSVPRWRGRRTTAGGRRFTSPWRPATSSGRRSSSASSPSRCRRAPTRSPAGSRRSWPGSWPTRSGRSPRPAGWPCCSASGSGSW